MSNFSVFFKISCELIFKNPARICLPDLSGIHFWGVSPFSRGTSHERTKWRDFDYPSSVMWRFAAKLILLQRCTKRILRTGTSISRSLPHSRSLSASWELSRTKAPPVWARKAKPKMWKVKPALPKRNSNFLYVCFVVKVYHIILDNLHAFLREWALLFLYCCWVREGPCNVRRAGKKQCCGFGSVETRNFWPDIGQDQRWDIFSF